MGKDEQNQQQEEDIALVRKILELRAADLLVAQARSFSEAVYKSQVAGTHTEGALPASTKWDAPRLSHKVHGQVCLVISEEFPAMLALLEEEDFTALHQRSQRCMERLKAILPTREKGVKGIVASTMEEDAIAHLVGPLVDYCGFLAGK